MSISNKTRKNYGQNLEIDVLFVKLNYLQKKNQQINSVLAKNVILLAVKPTVQDLNLIYNWLIKDSLRLSSNSFI
jgi:hypothetical protein